RQPQHRPLAESRAADRHRRGSAASRWWDPRRRGADRARDAGRPAARRDDRPPAARLMAGPTVWSRPPRLRTLEDAEEERRATWLELFFDLVFVVAVGQVAHRLTHDTSTAGFLRFAGLFVPVLWAWTGFTFYANRFDTDDAIYRA